jgi:hypothetical protein
MFLTKRTRVTAKGTSTRDARKLAKLPVRTETSPEPQGCARITLGLYRNRSTLTSLIGTPPLRGAVRIVRRKHSSEPQPLNPEQKQDLRAGEIETPKGQYRSEAVKFIVPE